MASIKGADNIAKYLQENPNARFKVLSGGDRLAANSQIQQLLAQQQQMRMQQMEASKPRGGLGGFLEGVAKSVVDPFVTAGKLGAEGVNFLGDRLSGNTSKYQHKFFDQDTNLLTEGLKSAAGIGSMFIPGGIGLKSALAFGAGSGLLSGLSQTNFKDGFDGKDIGNLVSSSLLGAGTGGLFNKIGGGSKLAKAGVEGFDAIDNAATGTLAKKGGGLFGLSNKLDNFAAGRDLNVLKRNVGVNAPSGGKGLLKGALVEKAALQDAAKFGIPLRSADDLVKLSDNIFSQFGGQADNMATQLTERGVNFTTDSMIAPLEKQLAKTKSTILKQPLESAINEIQSMAPTGIMTPVERLQIQREVGDIMSSTAGDNKTLSNVFRKVYKNGKNEIDNVFASNGLPGFKEVNNNLEKAIKYKEWANKAGVSARPKGSFNDPLQDAAMFGGAMMGGPGALGMLGASKLAQSPAGEQLLSKGATGLAGALRGNIPGAGFIGGARDKIGTALGNTTVQRGLRTGISGAASQDPGQMELPPESVLEQQLMPFMQQASMDPSMATQGQGGLQQAMMGQGGGVDMQRVQAAQQLLSQTDSKGKPLYSPSEVEKYLELTLGPSDSGMGGGKMLPAGVAQQQADMQYTLTELDRLMQDISGGEAGGEFGRVNNAIGKVTDLWGGDTNRTAVKSRVNTLAQTIGKALEGGKLTDSDIQRYREMLPSLNDTKGQALAKIQSVQQLLASQLQQQQQGFQTSGYNPFAGQTGGYGGGGEMDQNQLMLAMSNAGYI